MDQTLADLRIAPSAATVDAFIGRLNDSCSPDPDARRDTLLAVRRHPLFQLLLEDPYTQRAFTKPRGYAGDAVMLDYVYERSCPPDISPVGQAVFDTTTQIGNALSVVHRRNLVGLLIDYASARFDRPNILSIACGHLREAQRSEAVRLGRIATLFALDQDAKSLEVVAAEHSTQPVRTVHGSIGSLIRGTFDFPPLELVYAAGLFDYLTDELAVRLLHTMLDLLAPEGMLLIANFVPDNPGRAYMEMVMDWNLVLRTAHDVRSLASAIPAATEESAFGGVKPEDPYGNVAYLLLRKS